MIGKEQERQAIKGTLELAEKNIRDDAAYSWKHRAEEAEENALELKKRVDKLQDELAHAMRRLDSALEKYEISKDMYEFLWQMLNASKKEAEERMIESAVLMSSFVGDTDGTPISPNIRDFAKKFREYRRKAKMCEEMLNKMEEKYAEK